MKLLKFFAVGVGALLGLIVLAVVFVALTFDPNDYKEYAQTWVEERTGRSLTIDGDVELSLFPWLAVETGHVELGNAAEFGPEPFVAAQRVSARVRLMPLLLRREFEIGTVSVDGLELDLAVAEDGTTNWSDLLALSSETESGVPAEPAPPAAASDALAGLGIESVVLRGARVVWRERGEPRYIVSELALSTGAIAPASPVDLNVEMDFLDVATQRTAHVALQTTASTDTDGVVSAAGSTVDFAIGDTSGRSDAQGRAEIAALTFDAGTRLSTGAVRMTNTLDSPLRAGSQLASELGWNALDIDLATMSFTVDDFIAAANDVRARWQLVGEDLNSETALLRGSVVVEDAPIAGAVELSGFELPADLQGVELGNFSTSTAFELGMNTGEIELSNLAVNALGIDLRVQQATLRDDVLNAQLNVAPFRPDATLRRLAAPYVPDGVDTSQIGAVALNARISGTPQNFAVTGIQLAALGAEITGQIEVESNATGVILTGDVASNRFATDEIFAVLRALVPESMTPQTAGMLALAGQFNWNVERRTAAVSGLRVEAFGMRGTSEFAASGIGEAIEVAGTVQVGTFEPRELLQRFGLAVPQTSDETALSSAAVVSGFTISPTAASFDDLVVNLDDSRMTGTFAVTDFEDPFFRFTLAADRLDVDRYLPPQTPPGADDEATPDDGERRAGDIALSNEQLSAVNIDADVTVGRLRIAGMDFSNVRTSMVVGDGRMLLDSAHADLYGGSFDGRFHVDASTDVPSMLLQGTAARLDLAPLITALAESSNFSGTGRFDIDLTGRGPTVTDNLRSAAGTMGFELANGAIEGFNVDKTLCRAFNNARGNPAPRDVPDRSSYEVIRGTATVTDGIAATNDLIATIGSAQVRGSGTLALADQVVDYDLEARLARNVPIQGCAEMERIVGLDFPLEVTGPLSAPDISPDYSEVIRRVLEYQLREEVRDRILERLFD